VSLQLYEAQTLKDLEKKYLRHEEIGIKNFKSNLKEIMKKKCKESLDYEDMEHAYYDQLEN